MSKPYQIIRKLQEQSGSWFVILPKLWVEREGLKESDELSILFNDTIKIEPLKSKKSLNQILNLKRMLKGDRKQLKGCPEGETQAYSADT